ncbi:MAG: hypothetical protein AAFY24_02295, partial [Pseudomonadota bacterium]
QSGPRVADPTGLPSSERLRVLRSAQSEDASGVSFRAASEIDANLIETGYIKGIFIAPLPFQA